MPGQRQTPLDDVAFAFIDVETTGLHTYLGDRVWILLHVARLRVEAFQRTVAMTAQVALIINDDGFAAAGALIDA